MEELAPNESMLEGAWDFDGSSMEANDACKRIDWLINNNLIEMSVNGDGWEVLYQDPNDKLYWLLTYPQSHIHGGGPPRLNAISEIEAKGMFNV
ncbi:Imm27 family immunity protein [Methylomonas sp. UP202]|uniref:Imm27 family immunity protein n=1 Tax=Methylomonas sp. UP202 TaxID=3040943 RepID=UPI002478813F|nr:Imm27 family immunity protein [Methylomonas sp. UP202]WGS88255.1 Imm27 family immunity protein [Methylomonas sp. UP202]